MLERGATVAARPDLYAVLGVPRTATDAELTKAYRQRAKFTHPDAGGDPLAFRAVDRAWRTLSDPGLRAGYDAELDGEAVHSFSIVTDEPNELIAAYHATSPTSESARPCCAPSPSPTCGASAARRRAS